MYGNVNVKCVHTFIYVYNDYIYTVHVHIINVTT
jgi:hypothetical protein